jgi:hypothetical protein
MSRDLPTDDRLLQAIYASYIDAFRDYAEDKPNRSSKIWVPIDIEELAKRFGADADLIFGRLYYHLNGKYAQQLGEKERVEFFQLRVGGDRHCVNFPFLASVLAELREDRRRYEVSTRIAALSLVISIISIVMAVYL